LERLISYNWPGNIRELRNAVRSALTLCEGRTIRRADLPPEIRRYEPRAGRPPTLHSGSPAEPGHAPTSLEIAERRALLETIEQNDWNMTRTAVQLGLSRNTLYRKLKRHGIGCGGRPRRP
jgi:transcriptional regulator of acetoin/glycerol metabolism